MSKPERIAELDVLRGAAAVWVMLFHYIVRWPELVNPPKAGTENPFGEYAVHLFFIISGFVIFMTLQNTRTGMDFLVSRASRLYPAYWAAVIITAVFMILIPPIADRTVSAPQVLANLTMLQQWLRIRDVDGVYWTLAVELSFYGWMFVIFKLRKLDQIERIGALWLLVQIVVRGWERTQLPFPKLDPQIIPHIVSRTFLLESAHLFIAGVVFFRIRTLGSSLGRSLLLFGCFVTHYFLYGPLATPFLAIFFIVFMLIARRKLAWLAVRPLVFFGTISYPLYLIHQNIGYAIMHQLNHLSRTVQIGAAVAAALIIASILCFYIEKPALQKLRKWYAARKALSKNINGL